MGMESMKSSENKEQVTAGKELVEKASKFSPEQQKKTGNNIQPKREEFKNKQKSAKVEKQTGNEDSPEKMTSEQLKNYCDEGNKGINIDNNNKKVDSYIRYKGFEPTGQFTA